MRLIVTITLLLAPVALLLPAAAYAQVAGWVPTGGPAAGSVAHLDRGPDGALYAVASGARAFRSTDGGVSWERTPVPDDHFSVGTFAVAPDGSPDGALLAVGPVYCTEECFHDGAWRSPDGGDTWASVEVGADPAVVTVVATDGAALASGTRLQRSTDGGLTWTETGPPLTYGRVAAAPGGLAVAVRADTIYRSADAGATWVPTPVAGTQSVDGLALAPNGTVYAHDNGLYRLEPGAEAWEPLEPPTSAAFLALAVEPDGTVLLGTGAGAFRSEDGGETWAQLGMPEAGAYAFETVTGGTPGGPLLVGTTRGLWRGEPVGPFEQVGLAAAVVTALAAGAGPDGLPLLVAGTLYQGVHASRDGGQTWTLALGYDRYVVDVAFGPEGTVWVASIGDLRRSTDGGETWEDLPRGGALRALAVDADGIAYVGYAGAPSVNLGVFRSADGGQTWEPMGLEGERVEDLAAGPDGTVYAIAGGTLYRRGEGAWVGLRSGVIRLTPGPGGLILGSGLGAIYRSEDRGETWETVYEGGEGVWALALRGAVAVARGNAGAVASADWGQTWAPVGGTLPPKWSAAPDVAIDGAGIAYAGTEGHGVYRTAYAVASEDGAAGGSEHDSRLRVNVYPNPAIGTSSGAATVAVALEAPAPTTVAVYDVLGRRLAVLHEGPLPAGIHRFPFDASALPAGTYYARLGSGGAHATASVTVVR